MVPVIGREKWKVIPGQNGVSNEDNKNILELDNGDVYIIFEHISKHYIVYSKRMDVMVFKQKMLGKLVNT